MQNLYEDLVAVLATDDRLVADGHVMKNKLVELALRLDPDLLRLVRSHERLRQHFFVDVDDVAIFDKVKFQQFVSNKAFLPDSYTAYKNKIGLMDGENYLVERQDVVLAWPYKDCVLEGGQDREDAQRQEVFWNETLAPDQIDRLLTPKALVGAKRYTKDGVEDTTTISRDDNLIIKGNNLLALHTLMPLYEGEVKLIYIDPPYNTGSDSFKYNDRFNHSAWLTFMKNRLEVARRLLRRDGLLFIHIGDVEMHYLKVLADGVFDRENFVGTIPRKTRSGKDDVPYKLSQDFDWMLVYTNGASTTERLFKRLVARKYYRSDDFPNDEWRLSDLTKQTSTEERKNSDFTLVNPRNGDKYPAYPNRSWSITQDTLPEYLAKKKIVFPGDYDFLDISIPSMRTFKSEEIAKKGEDFDKSYVSTDFLNIVMDDLLKKFTNNKGTEEITQLFGSKAFAYPKNEALLARIIKCTTKPGDLVCDFYLGSGTTAAVAHKMGRRYIGIEQMDYVNTISIERLKKVVEGEQGGVSPEYGWQGGGSFVYAELAQANETFMQRIQVSGSEGDLAQVWRDMQERAFLSYRVDAHSIDPTARDWQALSLDEKKRLLMETLDKNMLYVPLSELDDENWDICEADKALNRGFFGV